MRQKRIQVPRTVESLTRDQRDFYELLPDDLRPGFLEHLGPLEIEPSRYRSNLAKQRFIHQRIRVLRSLVDACEKRIRELNVMWGRLERGDEVDAREIHRPPAV